LITSVNPNIEIRMTKTKEDPGYFRFVSDFEDCPFDIVSI